MKNTSQFFSQLNELMTDKNPKISRHAIGLYKELAENQSLKTYYQKVKEEAKNFIKEYFDEWTKDDTNWGLKAKEKSFYQWIGYDGKDHEWIESANNSFDCDEILNESNEQETDSGLWEGLKEWWQIKEAMAFWTLRNDIGIAIMDEAKKEAEKRDIDIDLID